VRSLRLVSVVRTAQAQPTLKPRNSCDLFLEHCAHQKNYVSEKTGSRLNFISFHPRDRRSGRVIMCRWELRVSWLRSSEAFKSWHLFRMASDRRSFWRVGPRRKCAACSARTNPQNAYRNGSLYAVYTAEILNTFSFWQAASASTSWVAVDLGV